MGLTIGIHYHVVTDRRRGEIKKCVSEKKYRKFPSSRKKSNLSLLVEFMGFPMDKFSYHANATRQRDVYWWPDVQFVPNDDSTLFVSAGVFDPRSRYPPCLPIGRIMKMDLNKETLKGDVFEHARMPHFPRFDMHPSGDYIGYIAHAALKIDTVFHEERFNKRFNVRAFYYGYCAFSPNGKYLAVMVSVIRPIKLVLYMIDRGIFDLTTYDKSVVLSEIVPGFTNTSNYMYSEFLKCKWSPDSEHIAICSSVRVLLVLDKNLELVTRVDEDIFPIDTFPSWSSTFDYDPRSYHECLAVGTNTRCLYFVNTVSKEILQKTDTICSSAIDCVQYEPNGAFVCVATRNFVLHFIDTFTTSVLFRIDMKSESPSLEQKNACVPNVISLSFSNTGEQLATSACDGMIRVYQMPQDISLFNMCKWRILSLVPQSKIMTLPIPKLLITKLLSLPTMR